jgi:hypothetical protein
MSGDYEEYSLPGCGAVWVYYKVSSTLKMEATNSTETSV